MRPIRMVLAVALCAVAVVPTRASAGNECRVIGDAVGDVGAISDRVQAFVADPGAGGIIDMAGFAVYLSADYLDRLVVEIGVADLDAPRSVGATAAAYRVRWRFDGWDFTVEALEQDGMWGFAARGERVNTAELEATRSWPVEGAIDHEIDVIRLAIPALALGDTAPKVLTGVNAWTGELVAPTGLETIPLFGAESITWVTYDYAPHNDARGVTLDLEAPCPEPVEPPGATATCLVASDPEGDASSDASSLGFDVDPGAPAAVDLTGIFVAGTETHLALELGVRDLDARADVTYGANYRLRVDVDRRTISLDAQRTGEEWFFDAYDPHSFERLPVTGSVAGGRIRFEIPFEAVDAARQGRPLRSFRAVATELLAPTLANWNGDDAAASPGLVHVLGADCPDV